MSLTDDPTLAIVRDDELSVTVALWFPDDEPVPTSASYVLDLGSVALRSAQPQHDPTDGGKGVHATSGPSHGRPPVVGGLSPRAGRAETPAGSGSVAGGSLIAQEGAQRRHAAALAVSPQAEISDRGRC